MRIFPFFVDWLNELKDLALFSTPRFYRAVPNEPDSIEIHVFGDASVDAFAAVAYLRFQFPGWVHPVQLRDRKNQSIASTTVEHPKT